MAEAPFVSPLKKSQTRATILLVIGLLVTATIFILLDWKQVRDVLGKSNLLLTIVSLLLTIFSYYCLSFGYVIVNRMFSIKIGWRDVLAVGLVSTALNNILAFMGAAGHSLRLVLLSRRDVKTGGILAASVFHSYLNNVIMLVFPVIGIAWVLLRQQVHGGTVTAFIIIGVFLVVLVIGATAGVLNCSVRSRLLALINKVWKFLARRDIKPFLSELDEALDTGVTELRANRTAFTALLILVFLYWAVAAAALYFCFLALGHAPDPGTLLCGFGIGIIAGNLSLIPGGLGVQEASLAGIFALLGTSFTQAALASILFRVVYDFMPFFISLVFYRQLMKRKRLQS